MTTFVPEHRQRDDIGPRYLRSGRSYIYVLPCHGESLLKIGYSRDPLQRFRTLHRRFFEFFDLGQGALIETEKVRDARRIERHFLTMFAPFNAPAPLVVPRSAAGHTEWYRGIHGDVLDAARTLCRDEGFVLHAPLRPWLRERLRDRADLLFAWTGRALEMIEFERFNPAEDGERSDCERALRDTLDMCAAAGLSLESLVPRAVLEWCRCPAIRARGGVPRT